MKNDRILSFLGLAVRGRNLVSGEFSTEKAVKEEKAKLVVVSADASDNTKKLFTNKCSYYHVPLAFYADKESLGKAVGKEPRSSVAVTDYGMAQNIIKLLEASGNETEVVKWPK